MNKMARFNEPRTTSTQKKTTNPEGATAWEKTPEQKLYSLVCTATLHDRFYESGGDRIDRLRTLLEDVDPDFAWKLAAYAREEMHLRTVPLVMAVELTKAGEANRTGVTRVIQRADELTEILAYYQLANDRDGVKPLANSLKRGVADAFHKFDEYQFSKYSRGNWARKDVKMRDVLFLTNPHPQDEDEEDIFEAIAEEDLEPPTTWEVELTRVGKEEEGHPTEKAAWEYLIKEEKLPYYATLRNLRNLLDEDISGEHLEKQLDYLTNEDVVRNARLLPFRYLTAYKAIEGHENTKTKGVLSALEHAAQVSVHNIEWFGFDEDVLIAVDQSGSMHSGISPNSTVLLKDIGAVLGGLLQTRCKSVTTGRFAGGWEVDQFPSNGVLRWAGKRWGGGSTNGWKVLNWLNEQGEFYDKVCLFTDLVLWDSENHGGYYSQGNNPSRFKEEWNRYVGEHPDADLYLFDLAGYSEVPIETVGTNAHLISGWSSEVFTALHRLEQGDDALDAVRDTEL